MQQIKLRLEPRSRRTAPPVNASLDPSVASEPETLNRAAPPSRLILSLLSALEREGISYCHWKSNWRLNDWLSGEGDLDLLVARADVEKFSSVLARNGFKKAIVPRRMELPGIVNFYGYDAQLKRFIHVHAHFQLVLGHDASKNFRIPVETRLLESARLHGPIRVPAPEIELAIFIIRMMLKYSQMEHFLRAVSGKLEGFRSEIRQEYMYLFNIVDQVKLDQLILSLFPAIGTELFSECSEALLRGGPAGSMFRLRGKLEKSLSPLSRGSYFNDRKKRGFRIAAAAAVKLGIAKPVRKRFESGGRLIALIGGDGSGKSTSSNDVNKWLGKKFDVLQAHLGTPPRSMTTLAVIAAIRVRRQIVRTLQLLKRQPRKHVDPFDPEIDLLQRLRWLCTARDRFRLFRKLRRFTSNGGIAICDRFPCEKLQLMDSPRIGRSMGGREPNNLERVLIERELSYYRRISPPDQMIVLRVDPELAIRRKSSEPQKHVSARASELWNTDWSDTYAEIVDANRSKDEVTNTVRSLVWAEL